MTELSLTPFSQMDRRLFVSSLNSVAYAGDVANISNSQLGKLCTDESAELDSTARVLCDRVEFLDEDEKKQLLRKVCRDSKMKKKCSRYIKRGSGGSTSAARTTSSSSTGPSRSIRRSSSGSSSARTAARRNITSVPVDNNPGTAAPAARNAAAVAPETNIASVDADAGLDQGFCSGVRSQRSRDNCNKKMLDCYNNLRSGTTANTVVDASVRCAMKDNEGGICNQITDDIAGKYVCKRRACSLLGNSGDLDKDKFRAQIDSNKDKMEGLEMGSRRSCELDAAEEAMNEALGGQGFGGIEMKTMVVDMMMMGMAFLQMGLAIWKSDQSNCTAVSDLIMNGLGLIQTWGEVWIRIKTDQEYKGLYENYEKIIAKAELTEEDKEGMSETQKIQHERTKLALRKEQFDKEVSGSADIQLSAFQYFVQKENIEYRNANKMIELGIVSIGFLSVSIFFSLLEMITYKTQVMGVCNLPKRTFSNKYKVAILAARANKANKFDAGGFRKAGKQLDGAHRFEIKADDVPAKPIASKTDVDDVDADEFADGVAPLKRKGQRPQQRRSNRQPSRDDYYEGDEADDLEIDPPPGPQRKTGKRPTRRKAQTRPESDDAEADTPSTSRIVEDDAEPELTKGEMAVENRFRNFEQDLDEASQLRRADGGRVENNDFAARRYQSYIDNDDELNRIQGELDVNFRDNKVSDTFDPPLTDRAMKRDIARRLDKGRKEIRAAEKDLDRVIDRRGGVGEIQANIRLKRQALENADDELMRLGGTRTAKDGFLKRKKRQGEIFLAQRKRDNIKAEIDKLQRDLSVELKAVDSKRDVLATKLDNFNAELKRMPFNKRLKEKFEVGDFLGPSVTGAPASRVTSDVDLGGQTHLGRLEQDYSQASSKLADSKGKQTKLEGRKAKLEGDQDRLKYEYSVMEQNIESLIQSRTQARLQGTTSSGTSKPTPAFDAQIDDLDVKMGAVRRKFDEGEIELRKVNDELSDASEELADSQREVDKLAKQKELASREIGEDADIDRIAREKVTAEKKSGVVAGVKRFFGKRKQKEADRLQAENLQAQLGEVAGEVRVRNKRLEAQRIEIERRVEANKVEIKNREANLEQKRIETDNIRIIIDEESQRLDDIEKKIALDSEISIQGDSDPNVLRERKILLEDREGVEYQRGEFKRLEGEISQDYAVIRKLREQQELDAEEIASINRSIQRNDARITGLNNDAQDAALDAGRLARAGNLGRVDKAKAKSPVGFKKLKPKEVDARLAKAEDDYEKASKTIQRNIQIYKKRKDNLMKMKARKRPGQNLLVDQNLDKRIANEERIVAQLESDIKIQKAELDRSPLKSELDLAKRDFDNLKQDEVAGKDLFYRQGNPQEGLDRQVRDMDSTDPGTGRALPENPAEETKLAQISFYDELGAYNANAKDPITNHPVDASYFRNLGKRAGLSDAEIEGHLKSGATDFSDLKPRDSELFGELEDFDTGLGVGGQRNPLLAYAQDGVQRLRNAVDDVSGRTGAFLKAIVPGKKVDPGVKLPTLQERFSTVDLTSITAKKASPQEMADYAGSLRGVDAVVDSRVQANPSIAASDVVNYRNMQIRIAGVDAEIAQVKARLPADPTDGETYMKNINRLKRLNDEKARMLIGKSDIEERATALSFESKFVKERNELEMDLHVAEVRDAELRAEIAELKRPEGTDVLTPTFLSKRKNALAEKQKELEEIQGIIKKKQRDLNVKKSTDLDDVELDFDSTEALRNPNMARQRRMAKLMDGPLSPRVEAHYMDELEKGNQVDRAFVTARRKAATKRVGTSDHRFYDARARGIAEYQAAPNKAAYRSKLLAEANSHMATGDYIVDPVLAGKLVGAFEESPNDPHMVDAVRRLVGAHVGGSPIKGADFMRTDLPTHAPPGSVVHPLPLPAGSSSGPPVPNPFSSGGTSNTGLGGSAVPGSGSPSTPFPDPPGPLNSSRTFTTPPSPSAHAPGGTPFDSGFSTPQFQRGDSFPGSDSANPSPSTSHRLEDNPYANNSPPPSPSARRAPLKRRFSDPDLFSSEEGMQTGRLGADGWPSVDEGVYAHQPNTQRRPGSAGSAQDGDLPPPRMMRRPRTPMHESFDTGSLLVPPVARRNSLDGNAVGTPTLTPRSQDGSPASTPRLLSPPTVGNRMGDSISPRAQADDLGDQSFSGARPLVEDQDGSGQIGGGRDGFDASKMWKKVITGARVRVMGDDFLGLRRAGDVAGSVAPARGLGGKPKAGRKLRPLRKTSAVDEEVPASVDPLPQTKRTTRREQVGVGRDERASEFDEPDVLGSPKGDFLGSRPGSSSRERGGSERLGANGSEQSPGSPISSPRGSSSRDGSAPPAINQEVSADEHLGPIHVVPDPERGPTRSMMPIAPNETGPGSSPVVSPRVEGQVSPRSAPESVAGLNDLEAEPTGVLRVAGEVPAFGSFPSSRRTDVLESSVYGDGPTTSVGSADGHTPRPPPNKNSAQKFRDEVRYGSAVRGGDGRAPSIKSSGRSPSMRIMSLKNKRDLRPLSSSASGPEIPAFTSSNVDSIQGASSSAWRPGSGPTPPTTSREGAVGPQARRIHDASPASPVQGEGSSSPASQLFNRVGTPEQTVRPPGERTSVDSLDLEGDNGAVPSGTGGRRGSFDTIRPGSADASSTRVEFKPSSPREVSVQPVDSVPNSPGRGFRSGVAPSEGDSGRVIDDLGPPGALEGGSSPPKAQLEGMSDGDGASAVGGQGTSKVPRKTREYEQRYLTEENGALANLKSPTDVKAKKIGDIRKGHSLEARGQAKLMADGNELTPAQASAFRDSVDDSVLLRQVDELQGLTGPLTPNQMAGLQDLKDRLSKSQNPSVNALSKNLESFGNEASGDLAEALRKLKQKKSDLLSSKRLQGLNGNEAKALRANKKQLLRKEYVDLTSQEKRGKKGQKILQKLDKLDSTDGETPSKEFAEYRRIAEARIGSGKEGAKVSKVEESIYKKYDPIKDVDLGKQKDPTRSSVASSAEGGSVLTRGDEDMSAPPGQRMSGFRYVDGDPDLVIPPRPFDAVRGESPLGAQSPRAGESVSSSTEGSSRLNTSPRDTDPSVQGSREVIGTEESQPAIHGDSEVGQESIDSLYADLIEVEPASKPSLKPSSKPLGDAEARRLHPNPVSSQREVEVEGINTWELRNKQIDDNYKAEVEILKARNDLALNDKLKKFEELKSIRDQNKGIAFRKLSEADPAEVSAAQSTMTSSQRADIEYDEDLINSFKGSYTAAPTPGRTSIQGNNVFQGSVRDGIIEASVTKRAGELRAERVEEGRMVVGDQVGEGSSIHILRATGQKNEMTAVQKGRTEGMDGTAVRPNSPSTEGLPSTSPVQLSESPVVGNSNPNNPSALTQNGTRPLGVSMGASSLANEGKRSTLLGGGSANANRRGPLRPGVEPQVVRPSTPDGGSPSGTDSPQIHNSHELPEMTQVGDDLDELIEEFKDDPYVKVKRDPGVSGEIVKSNRGMISQLFNIYFYNNAHAQSTKEEYEADVDEERAGREHRFEYDSKYKVQGFEWGIAAVMTVVAVVGSVTPLMGAQMTEQFTGFRINALGRFMFGGIELAFTSIKNLFLFERKAKIEERTTLLVKLICSTFASRSAGALDAADNTQMYETAIAEANALEALEIAAENALATEESRLAVLEPIRAKAAASRQAAEAARVAGRDSQLVGFKTTKDGAEVFKDEWAFLNDFDPALREKFDCAPYAHLNRHQVNKINVNKEIKRYHVDFKKKYFQKKLKLDLMKMLMPEAFAKIKSGSEKICITNNRQMDFNCSCQKRKTCLNPLKFIKGKMAKTMVKDKSTRTLLKTIVSVTHGKTSPFDVNDLKIEKASKKLMKRSRVLNKKLKKKYPKKKIPSFIQSFKFAVKKIFKPIVNKFRSNPEEFNQDKGDTGLEGINLTARKLLKDKGLPKGLGGVQTFSEIEELDESLSEEDKLLMSRKYKYETFHKKSRSNIWKIISHRYLKVFN